MLLRLFAAARGHFVHRVSVADRTPSDHDPALIRFFAIGLPMMPRPMNANLHTRNPPFKCVSYSFRFGAVRAVLPRRIAICSSPMSRKHAASGVARCTSSSGCNRRHARRRSRGRSSPERLLQHDGERAQVCVDDSQGGEVGTAPPARPPRSPAAEPSRRYPPQCVGATLAQEAIAPAAP